MESEIAAVLAEVLAPASDEQKAKMIEWATNEFGDRSVILLTVDAQGIEHKLGETSPYNEHATIFAMLADYPSHCVDIYCASAVQEEGGQNGMLYFKNTIWNPRATWGPVSIDAVYKDWQQYFEGDAPPAATNGASH